MLLCYRCSEVALHIEHKLTHSYHPNRNEIARRTDAIPSEIGHGYGQNILPVSIIVVYFLHAHITEEVRRGTSVTCISRDYCIA